MLRANMSTHKAKLRQLLPDILACIWLLDFRGACHVGAKCAHMVGCGQLTVMWCMLQPQLPANRDIVHLNLPVPSLASVGNGLGRRLAQQSGAQDMEGAQTYSTTTPTPAAAAGNILQSTVGVSVCHLSSKSSNTS